MRKSYFLGLMCVVVLMFGFVSASQATLIQSETILTNPVSTENLWRYSYKQDYSLPDSASFYITSTAQFTGTAHQGYVTGNYQSYNYDIFSSLGQSDSTSTKSIHVFETYIMSSIDQAMNLQFNGDDGHALFVDGAFVDGGGYGVTNTPTLNLAANIAYQIQFVGTNFSGPWGFSFGLNNNSNTPFGSIDSVTGITMNANANQLAAPVPEPSTALLLGSGLLGLGWCGRKRNKA